MTELRNLGWRVSQIAACGAFLREASGMIEEAIVAAAGDAESTTSRGMISYGASLIAFGWAFAMRVSDDPDRFTRACIVNFVDEVKSKPDESWEVPLAPSSEDPSVPEKAAEHVADACRAIVRQMMENGMDPSGWPERASLAILLIQYGCSYILTGTRGAIDEAIMLMQIARENCAQRMPVSPRETN